MKNFKSFGYLKYDPVSTATKYKKWWLLLKCDDGLTSYYRWWIGKEFGYKIPSSSWLEKAGIEPVTSNEWLVTQHGVHTTRSAWGSHISVVRGEKPNVERVWKKYENKKIWFEYNPEYMTNNGKHWWIKAISPQLEEIRTEMGLTPQPTYRCWDDGTIKINPFHITIGHMLN